MGYNITGILKDLRYGGNEQSRYNAGTYWNGEVSVLTGNRQPEIQTKNEIRNIINNFIIPGTAHTTKQSPVVTQQTILASAGEAAASGRVTTLFGIITDVIQNGLDNLPTLINNGISSVKIPERVELAELLLITNTTDNTVLYTFNDSAQGATVSFKREYESGTSNTTAFVDPDFPKAFHGNDVITTIFLNADTSADNVQMIKYPEDDEVRTRPYDFELTQLKDLELHKSIMLDADFEYGLPTKWQAIAHKEVIHQFTKYRQDFDIVTVTDVGRYARYWSILNYSDAVGPTTLKQDNQPHNRFK